LPDRLRARSCTWQVEHEPCARHGTRGPTAVKTLLTGLPAALRTGPGRGVHHAGAGAGSILATDARNRWPDNVDVAIVSRIVHGGSVHPWGP
jgi:hypothetical protein